jgi:transcription elongation factor GreB
MSKAFTKESDQEPEEPEQPDTLPSTMKNYVTPHGFALLQNELQFLLRKERPKIVETVRWAAGNGDRSENGDYIYGKKRLREIDRRVRYLTKQIDNAEVVNPKLQQTLTQIFFGATVTYQHKDGSQKTVKLVGIDEADLAQDKISWISPLARALMKARVEDEIQFHTPSGLEVIKILQIEYEVEQDHFK